MNTARRWNLWAHRDGHGILRHVGERRWVTLHDLVDPIVPVLVEELLGNLYAHDVTHYGWQYNEGSPYCHGETPTMIQPRVTADPEDPKRALTLLSICFPYGLDAEIQHGTGAVIALRITERKDR